MVVYEKVEVLLRFVLILSEDEMSYLCTVAALKVHLHPCRALIKIAYSSLLALCVKQLENCQMDFFFL